MRKRATDGTKISTSLSMTKNTVSTRSRADRLRMALPRCCRGLGLIRGGELPFVRSHLLLVIVAIARVDVIVAGERRRMQLAFRRGDQLEISAGVLAADKPGAHPHRPAESGICRDVADAEPDAPVTGPVRRRAVTAQRVVQREAAGRQFHHDAAALVEWLADRLPGAVDAVREPQRGMAHLSRLP